jgi:hypothetical protein
MSFRLAIGHCLVAEQTAPVTDDIALELIETRTFGSRVIYERYGRAPD